MMFPVAALILGLLGSLHCVGMCGPLALALPVRSAKKHALLNGLFLYNGGRALTYSALGALSGLAGNVLLWAAGQQALSITAGVFILMVLAADFFGKRVALPAPITGMQNGIRKQVGKLFRRTRPGTQFVIGMLNGFLPCGLVYAGLAGAAATGTFFAGALFMFVFGLGTMPALSALVIGGNKISLSFRMKLRKAVPVFVGVMAVLLILRGLGLGIPFLSPSVVAGHVFCPHCAR